MDQASIKALVLKREIQAETDAKVILFSQEFGRIEVFSKGLFKINSKFLGIILEGNLIKADLIYKKNYKIFSALLEKNFFKDLNFSKKIFALKALTLFEKLIIFPEKDLSLWRLLLGYLNFLSNSKILLNSKLHFAYLYFQLKLLKILGHLPSLDFFSNLGSKEKQILKIFYQSQTFFQTLRQDKIFDLNAYFKIQKKLDFYLKTTIFPELEIQKIF